jgi:ABC-type bacteriocin/lantibiotic exporter with double-glycine peptidase domain
MRYVKQIHKNGCAIAALAMLTGVGYNRILKITHPKRKYGRFRLLGTIMFQTLVCLNKLGIKYKVRYRKIKINTLKNNAYITVRGADHNHALVWDAKNKKILDPGGGKDIPTYTVKQVNANLNYVIIIL